MKKQVEEQWLKQVAAFPDDYAVLDHALNFLQFADPEKAVSLISNVKRWAKGAVWLGHGYGLRGAGVTGLDPQTGAPTFRADPGSNSAFETTARSALLNSNNVKVVLSGLAAVNFTRQSLTRQAPASDGLDAFCGEMLARAKHLYPSTSLSCDATGGEIQESAYSATNRGAVVAAQLQRKTAPVYPALAKNQRLQGTVKLLATIDRQGTIQNLAFLSGPLGLYASARTAVQHWEYTPTTINGKPVEVQTTVTVNYTL